MSTNKQALLDSAESTIGILENIAGFEPSDIDGDAVELRFETEGGFDTGCDVSIVDQCQKAADVIRALLDELEAAEKRIAELESRQVNEEVSDEELNAVLQLHRLKVDGHSQLSDAFRAGFKYSRRAAGITVKGE
ncbi:UNVERIFIED_ORG: putative coiled-coil protein SlyX [Enterobacter sp. BIGb0239]